MTGAIAAIGSDVHAQLLSGLDDKVELETYISIHSHSMCFSINSLITPLQSLSSQRQMTARQTTSQNGCCLLMPETICNMCERSHLDRMGSVSSTFSAKVREES